MYPFKRILVPTDFSLCAEAAYYQALYLGQRYKAEVHLLHVSPLVSKTGVLEPHGKRNGGVWPDEVTGPLPGSRVYAEHWPALPLRRQVIHHDDPVSAILTYAREQSVDFIVMGAHGDRGAGQFLNLGIESPFLGHTAEQVVRHAPCPVMRVVMRNARSPERIRRLLVPVDWSSLSLLALVYARDLAALYGARLDVLHVLEPHPPVAETAKLSEEQARAELVEAFKKAKGAEVSVGFHVGRGDPGRKIRAFVEECGADLVVMGTHSDLGQDVLGVVAEQVVRRVSCSVLTVRDRELHPMPSAPSRHAFPIFGL